MNLLAFAIEFAGAYQFAAAARLGGAASNPPSWSIPGQADDRVNLGSRLASGRRKTVTTKSDSSGTTHAAIALVRQRWIASWSKYRLASGYHPWYAISYSAGDRGCAKCHKTSLWYGLMIRTIGSL